MKAHGDAECREHRTDGMPGTEGENGLVHYTDRHTQLLIRYVSVGL